VTVQITLLPPPPTMPLHWLTDVTSPLEFETVVVQPKGASTPAAARHSVAVTTELVAPAAVTVLTTVTVQVTWNPAPVGRVSALTWATAGAVVAADATGPSTNPLKINMAPPMTNAIAVAN